MSTYAVISSRAGETFTTLVQPDENALDAAKALAVSVAAVPGERFSFQVIEAEDRAGAELEARFATGRFGKAISFGNFSL